MGAAKHGKCEDGSEVSEATGRSSKKAGPRTSETAAEAGQGTRAVSKAAVERGQNPANGTAPFAADPATTAEAGCCAPTTAAAASAAVTWSRRRGKTEALVNR